MTTTALPQPSARHDRWLDAAGIREPGLRAGYELCRRLHAGSGRTYYLATLLLPPGKRSYVNSLYGFARYADEIVDNGDPATMAEELHGFRDRALADLRRGHSEDPVIRALVDTVETWDIPEAHIEAFLRSMLMDLTVTEYETYEDLREYMYGSAAVIGLQMLPVLEPRTEEAHERAAALGEAFQLTNFVRDVGEDVDRGRVYLPQEDLRTFGVTTEQLRAKVCDHRFVELLRFQINRIRERYAFAEAGIDMLAPSSRDCIRTAFTLYSDILTEVERADYKVLDRRVSVGLGRRARVALRAYLRARRTWSTSTPPARVRPGRQP